MAHDLYAMNEMVERDVMSVEMEVEIRRRHHVTITGPLATNQDGKVAEQTIIATVEKYLMLSGRTVEPMNKRLTLDFAISVKRRKNVPVSATRSIAIIAEENIEILAIMAVVKNIETLATIVVMMQHHITETHQPIIEIRTAQKITAQPIPPAISNPISHGATIPLPSHARATT